MALRAFFELSQIRSAADKLGTPYSEYVQKAIGAVGAGQFLNDLLHDALEGQPPWWDALTADEHVAKVVAGLGAPPFADTSEHRCIRFSCLGVTWTVVFRNLYADTAVGERCAAALQVTLAHLAQHDPGFLPTQVTVFVTAAPPGKRVHVEEMPSTPEESRLSVQLPRSGKRTREHINEVARETLGAVTSAVVLPSTLNDDKFKDLLTAAMEDDLLSLIVFGAPYDAAWGAVVPEAEFATWPRSAPLLGDPRQSQLAVHPDLSMPDVPGPGYTSAHSLAEVEHRYRDLPPRMAPTLQALRNDAAFAEALAELRAEGWTDWQVLIAVHNLAKNARLQLVVPANQEEAKAMTKRFMAPEPPGDPMPVELFTADALRLAIRTAVGSSANSWWKLELRQNPLNPDAILRLLRTRYGWATDDVEHPDPFAARTEEPEAPADHA
ncbi:hypothetical protein [Nocardioides insulae]|uniref:hypothetical protein n=1 Tax=Nocardioides insulae TaxID=394734 RepID=UPI000416512F|nr:hypothetical protein [Nocardioides insulae]